VLLLLAVTAAGCPSGGDQREMALVKGKVTFNGAALPAGGVNSRVVFEHKEGPVAVGEIKPDGTYEATVAVGENGVKVEHAEDMIYPAEGRTGMPMPGKDLIPSKYAHVDTSGLKYTVKSGDQNYDINVEGEAPK
jgi:hypothetical protein